MEALLIIGIGIVLAAVVGAVLLMCAGNNPL